MQLAYIDVTDFQKFFSNEQDAQTYIISQRTKTTTKAPKWPYHPQQTNVSTLKHKSTTTQSLPTTNQHKFIGKMFEMIIINREKLTLYKSITGITFGIVRERKSQEMGRVWQEAVLRSLSLSLSLSVCLGVSLCNFGGMKVVGNWLLAEGQLYNGGGTTSITISNNIMVPLAAKTFTTSKLLGNTISQLIGIQLNMPMILRNK